MEEKEKYPTTIIFSKQESSRLIGGQARIEGFEGMGDFVESLFEEHMRKKKEE